MATHVVSCLSEYYPFNFRCCNGQRMIFPPARDGMNSFCHFFSCNSFSRPSCDPMLCWPPTNPTAGKKLSTRCPRLPGSTSIISHNPVADQNAPPLCGYRIRKRPVLVDLQFHPVLIKQFLSMCSLVGDWAMVLELFCQ